MINWLNKNYPNKNYPNENPPKKNPLRNAADKLVHDSQQLKSLDPEQYQSLDPKLYQSFGDIVSGKLSIKDKKPYEKIYGERDDLTIEQAKSLFVFAMKHGTTKGWA